MSPGHSSPTPSCSTSRASTHDLSLRSRSSPWRNPAMASRTAGSASSRHAWETLSDDQLLSLRFCDLKLSIAGTELERAIGRLYEELATRGIRFRPHCWLSQEWFSPDGIPGIAVPFYLAHQRLTRLERRFMREV